MAVTRAYLRREIGNITGGVLPLTATSGGTTTTLIDVINLAEENNSLVGRLGWVVEAANAADEGKTIRVTANTKSATSITFTPALAAATSSGDIVELYSNASEGPTIDQIHRAINRVIESVSYAGLTEVLDTETTFDADDPHLTIPASWRRLLGVEWEDAEEEWHEIPPADLVVDPVSRTVRVDNAPRFLADTYQIRLRGYTPAAQLTTDASETTLDAEFIVNEAASQLLLANAEKYRDPAATRAMAQYLRTVADSRRPKVLRSVRSRGWVLH